MEFECINEIKPEFEIWSKYIELIYQTAMEIDERPTTHPVRCEVPSPRNLPDIFDTISYAKGASIIRMLSFFVGKEKFRTAIMAYMEKFKYQNTKTKDLWDTFKDTIQVDVEPVMDSWLNLSGHPALDVELKQNENSEWIIKFSQYTPAIFKLKKKNSLF
jgi:aminopeptidase N